MKKYIKIMVLVFLVVTISCVSYISVYGGGVGAPELFSNFTSLYIEDRVVDINENKVHLSVNADFSKVEEIRIDLIETDSTGHDDGNMSKDLMLKVQDLTTDPYVKLPARVLKEGNKFRLAGVSVITYDDFNTSYLNPNEEKSYYDLKNKDRFELVSSGNKVNKEAFWNYSEVSLKDTEISVSDLKKYDNHLNINFVGDESNISKITCTFIERVDGGIKKQSDDLVLNLENLKVPYSQYVVLPDRVVKEGTILELFDVAVYDNDNQIIHYSDWTGECYGLTGNTWLYITKSQSNNSLKSVTLSTDNAKINSQVNVNLDLEYRLSKAMLSFVDETNKQSMIVYLKGIETGKPYFIVPYTTEAGKYSLKSMALTDTSGVTYKYEDGSDISFNASINILEENTNSNILSLDNDKITSDIIQKIIDAKDNIIISINADKDTVIDSALFSAIKGTSKVIEVTYNNNQWVFSGLDIKEAKDVDVRASIMDLNYIKKSGILEKLQEGMILEFADNGILPGKCLIRLAVTDTLNDYFGSNPMYVYYFDENGNILDKVALKISLSTDGYYEFYINHNSKYLLSNQEISSELVSNKTDALELNQNIAKNDVQSNDKMFNLTTETWIVIGIASVIIIILIIVFAISRRNMKLNKN